VPVSFFFWASPTQRCFQRRILWFGRYIDKKLRPRFLGLSQIHAERMKWSSQFSRIISGKIGAALNCYNKITGCFDYVTAISCGRLIANDLLTHSSYLCIIATARDLRFSVRWKCKFCSEDALSPLSIFRHIIPWRCRQQVFWNVGNHQRVCTVS
jgi:hypothetical protein